MANAYERLQERKKNKTTTQPATSTKSTSTAYDRLQSRKKKKELEGTVNLDTLDSDLKALGSTVESVYNGWQPQDAMNNIKASIVSMQERLNAYQEYAKLFGGEDITELAKGYQSILDDWDNRAATYGKFKTAEDYTKAAEREKSLPTADLNSVQAEVADLDKQIAEIKAQKEKFDSEYKANGGYIPSASNYNRPSANQIAPYQEWQAKANEYNKQIKDLENKKADRQAYYEDAKSTQETLATIQKETAMASDPNNMEGYNQYIANYEAAQAEKEKNPWWVDAIGNIGGSGSDFSDTVNTVVKNKQDDKTWQLPKGDWSDDEKRVLGGYFNEDPQKALDYVVRLNNEKAKGEQGKTEKKIQDSATSNFFAGTGHTVGSIVTAPLGLADYLDDLTDKVAGRPIIEESIVTPFEYSQAVTGGISTHLNEKSGTLNENIPVIGGKGLGDVYGLGTSVVQSAASAYTLGSVGTLISYFGQGAAAGVDDALSRGATDDQALAYGFVLGAAEGISENIGAERLLNLGSPNEIRKILVNGFKKGGGKEFWSLVDKQGKAEAIEELFSGIAGQVADNWIMQGKSNFDALTREYRALGMSATEASKKAWMKSIGDVAYDTLSGYLSGAVHAGPQIAVSAVKQNAENKTIGKEIRGNDRVTDMLNIASLSQQESDAYEAYTKYAQQGVNADNITDAQLGNLYGMSEADAVSTVLSKKATTEQKADAETTYNRLAKMKTENKAAQIERELSKTDEEGVVTPTTREMVINEQSKGMSKAEANLFRLVDDGKSNAVDYADSFNLVVAMAQNDYSQDYILEHRGVLSTGQVDSIYKAVVTNPKMAQQKRLNDLIQEQGDNLEIKGTIDDSVIDYGNTGAKGKVNWKDLHPNVKATIAYVTGFSTKVAGMDVQLVTNGRDYGFTGRYDRQGNTMLVDITALTERVKSADSKGRKDNAKFVISTVAHEVTHWMEEKAPELYTQYDKMVMDALTAGGLTEAGVLARRRALLEKAEAKRAQKENRKPREITDKEVRREVVARASEDMLALSEEGKKFFESLTENEQKQFVDKIKEVIQNIKDWIKNVLSKLTSEAPEAVELRALAKDLDAISKKWDEMLRQAAKTNAAMKKAGVNDKAIMESKTGADTQNADIDTYTTKQYNDFGWVAVNNVLTGKELKKLYSQFAKVKLNKEYNFKNKLGEYLLPVGNRYGSIDKIVYIKGTNKHPIIRQVVVIKNPYREYAEKIVEEVMDYEATGLYYDAFEIYESYAGEEIFDVHKALDYPSYSELKKGARGQDGRGTYGGNRERNDGASLSETRTREVRGNDGEVSYSDIDSEYMDAVERGDMETVQRMVDEAAKKAGYNTPHLYHGTPHFGFTRYEEKNHKYPFIYTSTNSSVAAHYAGDNHYAFVRPVGEKYDGGTSLESIIKDAKYVMQSNYRVLSEAERNEIIRKAYATASEIADRIDEMRIGQDVQTDFGDDGNSVAWVEYLFFSFRDSDEKYSTNADERTKEVFREEFAHDMEKYNKYRAILKEYRDEHWNDLNAQTKKYLSYLLGYDVGDAAIDIEHRFGKAISPDDMLINETGSISDPKALRESMDMIHAIGAYNLYGNLGDNPYVFDANGGQFYALRNPDIGEGWYDTDSISKWALDNGYTSVVMKNIYDYGDKADDYVFFDSSQIKSADPITYDDDRNIIPLSKRFDVSNEDIRYSDIDSEGNELSAEQQEFFKKSKVRDETGRLMVVYHGSANEFTVFNGRGNSKFGEYKFQNHIVNYFTTSKETAKDFSVKPDYSDGNVYAGYVNITNPYTFIDESEGVSERGYSTANGLRNRELREFEISLFKKYLPRIMFADSIEEVNEMLLPFNARVKDYGESEGMDRYELFSGGGNTMFASENFVATGSDFYDLFEDEELLNSEILGVSEEYGDDDYYYTTDQVVNLVIAMNNEEGTGYDGVIIDNIFDAMSFRGRVATDVITIKSSNQFKIASNKTPTTDPDIRYSDIDSDGNELTVEQQEFFKNSKALDKNGRLQKVYHGTRNANFTVFKRNVNFFTDNKEMAESYSPNGDMYEGYVNITKPYTIDAKGEKWSRIPVDDETKNLLQEYGASVFKENGKWRTTPADIASAIEEAVDNGDMDYDGIIIKNVDDTGSYYKGKGSHLATDYIVFHSNQFKNADNLNPTNDPDIRYSDIDELDDLNAQLREKQNQIYSASMELRKFDVKAEEEKLYAVMNKEGVSQEELDKALQDYSNWGKESGYAKAYEKHSALKDEERLIRREIQKVEDRLHAELKEQIAHWDDEEVKKYVAKAVRKYHTTTRLDKASYLVTTGSMLDFSDGQGYRVKDHREISEILDLPDYAEYSDGMIAFMNMGNIRLQTYGIDLSVMPNDKQFSTLRDIIFKVMRENDEFSVDFSKTDGYSAGSVTYGKGTSASKIIADIKSYFETGIVPEEQSSLRDFFYSDIDVDVDIYEILGENKRLNKENKTLRADFERLMELTKLEKQLTHGKKLNENQLEMVAGHIRNLGNSNYSKTELINKLREVYTHIVTSDNLAWDDLFARFYGIADDVLSESRPVRSPNDYYANIYRDLRKTEISLSDEQKQYVKDMLGVDYHKAFFGKIKVTENGIPLNSKWEEWARKYPNEFAETNDKDQVLALLDIYETAKELKEVVEEYDKVEQARWLANEIYNQYWNVSTIRTTADKYDKQIKRLKYEHRNTMKELRDSYNERIEKQKQIDRAERSRIFKKLREDHIKELKEIRKSGKERLDKYKEDAARKTRVQSITAQALTLNEWLVKNSKDKHIPEAMRGPVINLLQAIDFSSQRALGMRGGDMSGVPTQKDISLQKALSQVKQMMADASVGKEDLVELYGHDLDDDIKAMVESVDDIMRAVGDNEFILNKMTLNDLITLDNVVKTIKHAVTKMNKFHTVHHAKGIANLAQEEIIYAEKLGKAKIYKDKSLKTGVRKLLAWKNINPYYAFKRFGDAGKKIFEAFQDGYDKFAFNVKQIIDFTNSTYKREEVREWEKEIKTFKLRMPVTDEELANPDYKPQYQEVKMTVAQIMDLYLLNKREAAKVHLLGGGIRVANIETKKGEVISQSEGALLAQDEIDKIINTLTPRQIEVANALSRFMNTVTTDWGNEVSMARFGYRAFGEKNYVPMQVDKNNLAVEDETEKNNSLFRLLNMSFTKSLTEGANNRLVISSIFDVFAQHTSDMAKYNALALPVLDAFRWYNYKEKGYKAGTAFETKSVKQAIENAFGKDGQSYITTFLKDLNGQENTSRDTLGKSFFTNAKIAAVGANIRVALLQPTAFLRASANIAPKHLFKGVSLLNLKKSIGLAEKYCGMALWKSLGYYDTNVQRGVADQIKHAESKYEKAIEMSMKGAELADKVTFGWLWNAAESEIKETRKDLQVGSEEFYTEVGKRLRDIIYATQVVDSVMTRSEMMRSSDGFDKFLTTFASEPTISYSMLADAYFQTSLDAREMGSKKAAITKNAKHVARVFVAYTVTNLASALVESVFDILRDSDDDDEEDALELVKLFLENFLTNQSIAAKIPWIKEAVSIAQGFSSSRLDTQGMQAFANAVKQILKLAQGEGSWGKTIKSGLQTTSYLSGLPFYNAYRDALAFLDWLTPEELDEMLKDFY